MEQGVCAEHTHVRDIFALLCFASHTCMLNEANPINTIKITATHRTIQEQLNHNGFCWMTTIKNHNVTTSLRASSSYTFARMKVSNSITLALRSTHSRNSVR